MVRDPDRTAEAVLWERGLSRVVGIDEAGMGALAGAVVAAAVLTHPGEPAIPGVRDSKMLSAARRVLLAERIHREAAAVGIGAASPAEIGRLGIRHATHLAMRRAIGRIPAPDHVLVDGLPAPELGAILGPFTAIVRGDASSYPIACASIVAKVTRDALMDRLSLRYPGYGWDRNAGYGTADHLAALARLGPTVVHRAGFAPVRAAAAGSPEQLGLDLESPATSAPPSSTGR